MCVGAAVLMTACGGDGGTEPESTFDLSVGTAYIVQSAQSRNGTVPLMAGRAGMLRVFVVASEANAAAPSVSVQIYSGATLTQTLMAAAPGPSVPTAVNQSSLANSWNFDLPGSVIQPGLRFLVTVDPQNTVDERNRDNNVFPVSNAPRQVSVSVLPPLRLRLVPIRQTENGLTGDVTAANQESYLALMRKIFPVPDIDVDVRETYPVRFLEIERQGPSWVNLVSELDAVRVAEGTDRYYYGVVKTPYPGGGVVGIANGIGSKTALGWDRFPDALVTIAHELGHNWGRRHAPACGAGGPDPNYPDPVGRIVTYGLDLVTRQVKGADDHVDIMGYCDGAWIGGYTYTGIYDYRRANDGPAPAVAQPALLVWGRIDNGELTLEPSFQVVTRPVLPRTAGPYTVEGRDENGSPLFSVSFAGEQITDVSGDHRSFAFAIPLAEESMRRLASVKLRGRGREVARSARVGAPGAPLAAARRAPAARLTGSSVSLEWDADAHPAVMVRDARTGTILTIARDGRASFANSGSDLELLLSDGVRTTRTRVRP